MSKQVVFIMSPGRSGSTLLELMLGSHPQCSALGEFRNVQRFAPEELQYQCSFCKQEQPCDIWISLGKLLKDISPHDAACEAFSTPILIDSSKDVSWMKKALESSSLDYKVLRITRQALPSLSRSKRKQGFLDKESAQGWVRINLEIDNYLNQLPKDRVHWLKYEDLCEEPEPILGNICSFLGIEMCSEMRDFWKVPHHLIMGNGTTMSFVRLYHGLISEKDLHPDARFLYEKYGFAVQQDKEYMQKHKHSFSEEDRACIEKYAGWIDHLHGYEGSSPNQLAQLNFYISFFPKFYFRKFFAKVLGNTA